MLTEGSIPITNDEAETLVKFDIADYVKVTWPAGMNKNDDPEWVILQDGDDKTYFTKYNPKLNSHLACKFETQRLSL